MEFRATREISIFRDNAVIPSIARDLLDLYKESLIPGVQEPRNPGTPEFLSNQGVQRLRLRLLTATGQHPSFVGMTNGAS